MVERRRNGPHDALRVRGGSGQARSTCPKKADLLGRRHQLFMSCLPE